MTENGPLDSLIPSISKAFGPGRINLLDRLRQFPEYEQTRDERSSEIDRWKAEVLKRAGRDAPRRVLFVHGQLPGETGSGVYMQQIVRESIRKGIDMYVLSAGYKTLDGSDVSGVPDDRIFKLFVRTGRRNTTGGRSENTDFRDVGRHAL